MRRSFASSWLSGALAASGVFAGFADAQTAFPYYGPSAFVSPQSADENPILEPPAPSEDDSATAAIDRDIEARLKALEELEARFGSLETDWKKFRKAQEAAEEEKEADEDKPLMKINGRIQLDWWSFLQDTDGIGYFEHDDPGAANFGTDPEDRLAFRRVRLEISGTIPNDLFYRMQVEFNDPSNLDLKDNYLGFGNLAYNQKLMVGIQKRPISLDQWDSSRYTVFLERPAVGDAFDEYSRLLGACMWGFSDARTWVWQYGVFGLEDPQGDGRIIGDSMQLSGNGRLGNTFLWRDEGRQYAYFGTSLMIAHPDGDATDADSNGNEARFRARPEARSDNQWVDTGAIDGADWYEISGLEAVYNDGPLQVVGEWMTNWTQRDDAVAGRPEDLRFHGGYVYVSYVLTGEHIPWDRESGQLGRLHPFHPWTPWRAGGRRGWGALDVAARYSFLDLTDEDILGGHERNVTLALNWHWTAHAKLQCNVGYGEIYGREPIAGFDSGSFWTSGMRFACDF